MVLKIELVRTESGQYGRPEPGTMISSQRDMVDLLARCLEAGVDQLLFPLNSLAAEFFDLSTGLAGEISQKLSTYRIKTAIVVDLGAVPSQRFKEWAGECNRGNEIHFYHEQLSALGWLLEDQQSLRRN